MNEVRLPQVGLRGIPSDTRAMFNRCTTVSVAFNTQTLKQHDFPNGSLGKCV
jgi:hypothetical protein